MAKIFKFHGNTLEEMQKMSLEEFAKLLPSRSRRALLKRGISRTQKMLLEHIKSNPTKQFRTQCRELVVLPQLIGQKVRVHNCKEYVFLDILPEMIGRRLGEYVETRKRIKHSAPGMGATRSSKFVPLK
jgi:small subunit ribosomal protein S19